MATGALYDGALGVMAGLEVIAALNDAKARTLRPIVVAALTNEEGARVAPDMMRSGGHQGALDLAGMLDAAPAGARAVLHDELARTGYAGDVAPRSLTPATFLELHI